MFWRLGGFGFTNGSTLDSLLDKAPDLALEQVLDEDDLLQECKSHNPKLIEYLRDPNVLKQLLDYMIIDNLDDMAKQKYSQMACEILSCEMWSIYETIMENKTLLYHFWGFLEKPAPLDPLQASYFFRVNEQFLEKKTDDMILFIQSIPNVMSKMLRHIETSAIMDLLLKMISIERSESGIGMIDWLQSESLIPFLLSKIDPHTNPTIQMTAADILKSIIAISASPIGQGGIGVNSLLCELASKESMEVLIEYMLHRDAPFSSSSLVNGASIIIELIRKNNSDYDRPSFLDLSLTENSSLAKGSIYLGTMLKIFASHISDFQKILFNPKMVKDELQMAFGKVKPLGIERFRICELYAELLHCSNMVLLNSPKNELEILKKNELHDKTKKVQNTKSVDSETFLNLKSTEVFNSEQVSSWNDFTFKSIDSYEILENNQDFFSNKDNDVKNIFKEKITEIKLSTLDDNVNNHSQELSLENRLVNNTFEEILDISTDNLNHKDIKLEENPNNFGNIHDTLKISRCIDSNEKYSLNEEHLLNRKNSANINESDVVQKDADLVHELVVGDYLKMQFIEHKVFPTDMFFMFPWNNFLHNVVYDLIQQIFNGPMDKGCNSALVIDIFSRGQICEKIVQAQKESDNVTSKSSGVRLGYMGHLTLIAEEVIKFAERYPPHTVSPIIVEKISSTEWIDYVEHSLAETRARNNAILGGVRPHHLSLNSVIGFDTHGLQDFMSDASDIDYDDDDDDDDDDLNKRINLLGIEDNDKHSIDGTYNSGSFGHNQFLKYIDRQIVDNFPNKYEDLNDDEKEDTSWIEENNKLKQDGLTDDLNGSRYQKISDSECINGSLNDIFEQEMYSKYKKTYIDKNINASDFLTHDKKEKVNYDYDNFNDEVYLNPDNGIQTWNYELFNSIKTSEQEIQESRNTSVPYNNEYY
ncbi:unnamed protein product, partial [Pneumocystis jirovecii]